MRTAIIWWCIACHRSKLCYTSSTRTHETGQLPKKSGQLKTWTPCQILIGVPAKESRLVCVVETRTYGSDVFVVYVLSHSYAPVYCKCMYVYVCVQMEQ